jgi:hypothetical protein
MSTTPPSDPNKDAAKKEQSNATLWAVLSAVFAVGLFFYSGKVDPEKKSIYLIGGAIAAIIAAVNGYSAYTLSQKAKQPPKS